MVDHDRITLVRKDMNRLGIGLGTNRCCEITRLLQHQQGVVKRYTMEFAGCPVQ